MLIGLSCPSFSFWVESLSAAGQAPAEGKIAQAPIVSIVLRALSSAANGTMPRAACNMVRNFDHPCPGAAMAVASAPVALADEPNIAGNFVSTVHCLEAR